MAGHSAPRYRHDGTSPLPLGMDASPPPSRWSGLNTIWPHNPHSGWSYCVMIPSWVVLPERKTADGNFINPIVFYKVQVGIQSPEGVSTVRGILRRFSDFTKLATALKRTFPQKALPPAPPKNTFRRISSTQSYLQERRQALVEWMVKLLEDIDVSRSSPMASFLELEAAARAAMNTINEAQKPANFHDTNRDSATSYVGDGQSVYSGVSSSLVEHGSDFLYETSGKGLSGGTSEEGLEVDLGNLDLEQQMGKSDLDYPAQPKSEESSKGKDEAFIVQDNEKDTEYREMSLVEHGVDVECLKRHGRMLSIDESVMSEASSFRASETSTAAMGDRIVDALHNGESRGDATPGFDFDPLRRVQMALPGDQRANVKRILTTLQRRLNTSKTDLEDLIARLNQEIAVKEFLTIKVKDLEWELDTSRRNSREALQRAVAMERESFTNLQWESEECRASLLIAEEQAQKEQEARSKAEEKLRMAEEEKGNIQRELNEMKVKLERIQKEKEISEAKAKSDIRTLAKEIKSLRKTQPELKQELEATCQAKYQLEETLNEEKKRHDRQSALRSRFLHEVDILRQRLHDCSVDVLSKQENKPTTDSSSASDAIDLLMTSDDRIGFLLAEAQLLAEGEDSEEDSTSQNQHYSQVTNGVDRGNGRKDMADEAVLRKLLTEIFIDNAQLRKALNSLTRNALLMSAKADKRGAEEPQIRRSVLNRFL